ncbi:MAG: EMI domain-containing protein [Myxococcales bacterium]|nr:EMI domain-containing protein [Myxococcales bacterium]
MRRVLPLVLLTCVACVSARVRRGEEALTEGRAAEALASFEAALVEAPDETRALEGRRVALGALMRHHLERAAKARTDGNWRAASRLLGEAADLVTRGAEPKTLVEQERGQLDPAIAAWLREPLSVGQPLEAESRIRSVAPDLERAGLSDVTRVATVETKSVGARRCAVVSPLATTPWLATLMGRYCAHFSAAAPALPPMPERRAKLSVHFQTVKSRPELTSALAAALEEGFTRSVWFAPNAPDGLPVQVTGTVESQRTEAPLKTFVTWSETESYSVNETQTENYQESYLTTESRPYQVSYTTTESYTYSCGSGTRYQTCTGSRPVTRYRTEYRTESVTKTRPATRQVTRTVYKTRPVTRRFDFAATQVTARHAATFSIALALPGTAAPLVVDVKDDVTADDLDHDVTHPPAKLAPHRAQVLTDSGFEARVVDVATRRVSEALERAWVTSFCTTLDTPEAAARCVASKRAPAEAWVPLSRFTGERVEDLQLLLEAAR